VISGAGWLSLVTALVAAGCSPQPAHPAAGSAERDTSGDTLPKNPDVACDIRFEDVTSQWGIAFSHVSGNSPDKHFPAANGSGVGIFDFDSDGRMDIYLLTARPLPFQPDVPGPSNKLFRNKPDLHFEEISAQAGLNFSLFCHGIAHGDLDNDGFTDLVLTTYGGTQLIRNYGDGTYGKVESFTDDRWGSSAALADFDEDGALDIYVTHYGHWSIETNMHCGDTERQVRTFCSPKRVTPAIHALYRNLNNGEFVDITREAGIARDDGRGQGVVASDIDLDGHVDLYVANDLCPNFLFFGNGDGTFRDNTELSGAGLNRDGLPHAGMGVDTADINRDGLPDLFVTNFRREYNALYLSIGSGTFLDKSHALGVAGDSMDEVGWGTRLVDFDNDGWPDIFVTNGHVDDNIAELDPNATYAELPKIWKNFGGRFRYIAESAGKFFETKHVGRGAAFGDLDNDGRIEIVVNHVDSSPVILHNIARIDADCPTPWIRFSLIGTVSNRDAVGTRVELVGDSLSGKFVEQRKGGGSYLSAHDPRLHCGVGKLREIAETTVHWPSNHSTSLHSLATGQELRLVEPTE
jgi:enediyne biosynthesis protein E4